jgi:hypothetical protein
MVMALMIVQIESVSGVSGHRFGFWYKPQKATKNR